MDVQKKLDEIAEAVGSARAMPMSASCVVNRAELLALLEEVRTTLPGSLAQAEELLGGREQMVEEARREADRIIESAHAHHGSLVSGTEIARRSQEEADRILTEARREAEEIQSEADDYVDSKLANFEVVLTKTIGSVDRGRDKLLGRGSGADAYGAVDEDAPERSADPETLRQRADAYVETKLGAFEAVLTKTLDAVGRGRQKLLGRRGVDELSAHMASQDGSGYAQQTSDAEYLAGLADPQEPAFQAAPENVQAPVFQAVPENAQAPVFQAVPENAQAPVFQAIPENAQAPGHVEPPHPQAPHPGYQVGEVQQDYYAPVAGYQQDAYGYPVDPAGGYVQQDVYGYPAQDAYAWQQQAQGYDPNAGYAPGPLQGVAYQYPEQQFEQYQLPHQQPHQQPDVSLDESSLFDTGMIDLDQLRQYEQGR